MREWRIRQNSQHLKGRILIEGRLLPLNDRLVLHETLDETVQKRAGDGVVRALEVVEVRPEEVRRTFSFRRHELAIAVFPRAREIARLRALAGGSEQRLHGE